MSTAKHVIYGILVLCYILAAVCDLHGREWKLAAISGLFAVVTAVIYFWQ